MSDRIVVMNAEKVEQIGTPGEIYETSETPFLASFIGWCSLLKGAAELLEDHGGMPGHTDRASGRRDRGNKSRSKSLLRSALPWSRIGISKTLPVLLDDQSSRDCCQVFPTTFSHNERLSNGDPVVAEP